MRSLMPAAFATVYAALPLFPGFITLSAVAYPGVSIVPVPIALAILGLACVLAIVAGINLFLYRNGAPAQPLLVPMAAWVGSAILSALLGLDPHAGLLFACILGLGIVWHCAAVRFWNDPGVTRAIFWSYLLSGTLACALALLMVATRTPAALYAIHHGRAVGTFVLPGELAAYLVVFLPIAFALGSVAPTRALRALAWIALGIGLVTLAATFSRAGWMGFAAAAAFFVAVRARATRYGLVVAVLAIAAGAAAVALFFNVAHNPAEDYTRIAIWQAATQVIDRFPLTGVGPFDFSRIYPLVRVPDGDVTAFHAHSLYLTFFAELGILGLAAFVFTGLRFAREMYARLAAAPPAAALLALAAAAGLVGVAVQGLVDTMSVVMFGLWMPTMGFALGALRWAPEGERPA